MTVKPASPPPSEARDRLANTPVTGQLSTAYVAVLDDFLRPHGLDLDALPGGPALRALVAGGASGASSGAAVMPVTAWRAVLQAAAQRLALPDLGLRLGASARLAHLGVLGYVLQSCGTLGAALERLQRYERLVNDINRLTWQHVPGDDAVVLRWGQERGRPGPLVDECAIATLVQVTREICAAGALPVAVTFVNPAPADLAPYTAFFGLTPGFDAPQTEVRFPASLLTLPLARRDASLLGLLETQVEALLTQLPDAADVVQQVRRLLVQGLHATEGGQAAVAAALHVSERTLHRRLAEAGTTYRALREETRQHLAEACLRDPRLTLSEVAGLLGFSEQSAFTRAFTRWTGLGPKAWRARHG